MLLIQQITSATRQTQKLILADGSQFKLTIVYKPLQFGWFIEQLTHGDFTAQGLRICTSPNMLLQFKNQIPFGLACFTVANREPTNIEDFSSGASKLYVLTSDEVNQYSEFLSGQTG